MKVKVEGEVEVEMGVEATVAVKVEVTVAVKVEVAVAVKVEVTFEKKGKVKVWGQGSRSIEKRIIEFCFGSLRYRPAWRWGR